MHQMARNKDTGGQGLWDCFLNLLGLDSQGEKPRKGACTGPIWTLELRPWPEHEVSQ